MSNPHGIDPARVTACLVTRGNVEMKPIIEAMPFDEILIYDNSKEDVDLKVFGRYEVTKRASHDVIAWVDDDVIFTHWDELLAAWEPNTFVSNNAHGPNTGGYDDLALQAAGALCPIWLIADTWAKWFMRYPHALSNPYESIDVEYAERERVRNGTLYEADFIFGVLCKSWKQIDLPYTRLYADDNTRLCRQPWQEELKFEMTQRARAVRDSTAQSPRSLRKP